MKNFLSIHLDAIGFSASLLCAIHCALIPVCISLFTWSGFVYLSSPWIEITILIASSVLAVTSFIPAYLRHHKKGHVIALALVGFIIVGLGRTEFLSDAEFILVPLGAIMIAFSHILNGKFCYRYKHH